MADLLGAGFELVEIHRLYECLDKLLEHKQALFDHLRQRWKDLFNAKFDVLLYDLTSTYFESDPPFLTRTSASTATVAINDSTASRWSLH